MIGWKVRTSGNTYYRTDKNRIRNIFNLRIIIRSYILRYVIIEREIREEQKRQKNIIRIYLLIRIIFKYK